MTSPSPISDTAIEELVTSLADRLITRAWMFATAESCTGGMIAAACTDLAGSSAWFDRGFVTYSNEAKADMLGVDPDLIDEHGAVSEEVAIAMAEGAIKNSNADVAVAVTGIAGPSGGSAEKPVGTVWFAFASTSSSRAEMQLFKGDRAEVRRATVEFALANVVRMTASS